MNRESIQRARKLIADAMNELTDNADPDEPDAHLIGNALDGLSSADGYLETVDLRLQGFDV